MGRGWRTNWARRATCHFFVLSVAALLAGGWGITARSTESSVRPAATVLGDANGAIGYILVPPSDGNRLGRLAAITVLTPGPGTAGACRNFGMPAHGPISQGFGPSGYWFEPSLIVDGRRYAHFHTGVDIAAPWGSPVVAAADGKVASVGWDGSYGLSVVLQHANGQQTRYAHLSRTNVARNEVVRRNTPLGAVGTTGNSTGPHLHFEIRTGPASFGDPGGTCGISGSAT